MREQTREQVRATYKRMAEDARYRPAAPSDGFGNIAVPAAELDLDAEMTDYAERWGREEDNGDFHVGVCNYPTRPATILAIEAARQMCSGSDGDRVALALLRMAVAELEALEAA